MDKLVKTALAAWLAAVTLVAGWAVTGGAGDAGQDLCVHRAAQREKAHQDGGVAGAFGGWADVSRFNRSGALSGAGARGAEEAELTSLGVFTAYAYCPCPQCCGRWSGGSTASGTMPEEGRTVAADWDVLPAGTEIYLDGLGWRTVEDTGAGIDGQALDVFYESHQEALEQGVRQVEVWTRGD